MLLALENDDKYNMLYLTILISVGQSVSESKFERYAYQFNQFNHLNHN